MHFEWKLQINKCRTISVVVSVQLYPIPGRLRCGMSHQDNPMAGRRLSRGMSHQDLIEISARALAARAARAHAHASSQRARGMVSGEAMHVPNESLQQDIVGCSARSAARALSRAASAARDLLESGPGPGEGNAEAADGSDDMDPEDITGEAPVKRRRLGDGVDTVTLISNQVHACEASKHG